jgi:hypothetical protein
LFLACHKNPDASFDVRKCIVSENSEESSLGDDLKFIGLAAVAGVAIIITMPFSLWYIADKVEEEEKKKKGK